MKESDVLLRGEEIIEVQGKDCVAYCSDRERDICRAELKKVVEWMVKHGELILDGDTIPLREKDRYDLLIRERKWESLKKIVGVTND